MPHGTPPLHRHANFWRVQVDSQIWNSVEHVSGAFHRGGIDAVLDAKRLEGSARKDGLANDGVRPGNRISVGVEAGGEAIVPHRTIPAALRVVFAGPHNLHGSFGGFRDMNGFDDKIRVGIGAASEAPTEQRGVNLHFFRWKSRYFGSVGTVDGFK